MRRSAVLLLGLGMLIAVIVAGTAAAAEGEAPVTVPLPTIELGIDVGFSPTALPKSEAVPVSLTATGEIGDRIFGQPPPLRELTMEFDRGFTIHMAGIPACRRGRLGETAKTAAALKACRSALIGEGESAVEVHYPETEPIKIHSRLLVFKGGEKDGKTTLLLRSYFSDPISAAVVVPVTIAMHLNRRFGTRTVAKIPQLAGGWGSLIKFDFEIFREVEADGKRINPISATCADDELRVFDLGRFENGNRAEGEVIRACTPLKGIAQTRPTSADLASGGNAAAGG
jgi:hypothetical protein